VIAARNRLSSEVLGHRYQAIVDKLAEFGVSVKAADDPHIRFTEGPATVMYRVVPGSGVTPNSISQKSDSLKLALRLKEEQEIRFSIDEGYVTIDVPKSDDDRYFVAAEELWQGWTRESQALSCPIGIDRSGNSVEINFSSSNSPHLLIGGTTGSGKSEALNTILSGLIHKYSANELRLLLIDPKGTELEMYEDAEHLEGMIGMDDDDANDLLTVAVEEMQARYKLLKSERTRSISEYNNQVSTDRRMPWWLIVLDEYADLTSDPDAKKKIEANLKRLAQKARAAGIHVIIATQKPSAEVISTNLRSNLPAQLALRVKNGTESRVVMDELGAETLNGKGDAFLKSQGKLTRVQCAMVSS
jgi:DNA segregation ATPase FtsK/SpoIIIE-like protein